MPTPTATVLRPGRRSHRGRPRPRKRSRFRIRFARRCSTSWASSSTPPVSAAPRRLKRRCRAASARASALATSSSGSASDAAAPSPPSAPALDCGSSGSVTSLGSPESLALAPSGSCTEKQLITPTWAQRRRRTAALVAPTCGNTRSPGNGAQWRSGWSGAGHRSVQVIFSNQENFLFRCGRVIGCDHSWLWLPRCSVRVWWRRRKPRPGRASATTLPAPRASCLIRFSVRRVTTPPTTPSVSPTDTFPSPRSQDG